MSGLMIFNAHPRLYWGSSAPPLIPHGSRSAARNGEGFLRVGAVTLETTGVLGSWRDADWRVQNRAFPGWATIPSRL
jgi:hypothetical protein